MKLWRRLSTGSRIFVLLACLPLLDLFACGLFAPSTWNWTGGNLQIRLHNDANLRAHRGCFGTTAGYSKLSLASGDWFRHAGPSTWGTGRGEIIHEDDDFRIVGFSPGGVSIRVRYREDTNGTVLAFDRVLFVPTHREGRLDISSDLYVTGKFE